MSLPSAHGFIATPAPRPAGPSPCPFSLGYDSHPRSPGGVTLQCSSLKTPWTEEPGWLQSMGSQTSQTRLKRLNSSSIGSLGLLGHYSAPDFHSDSPFLISSPPLSKFYNISTLIPGISVNNSLCTQPFLCMLNALASIIILHVLPWGHIGWDGLSSHGTVLRFAGHLASLAHLHTRCQ